jgi:hypothetical protein
MNLKEPLWQPPGMPIHQRNANVVDGLLMRVGIPHSGGKLAFHAFNEGYAAMVSASAFWNTSKARFRIPEATDLTELDFALDSAGYTAMKLWQAKGRQRGIAGVFPWTYEEYVELASLSGAAWVSQPDLCCEPDIAADQKAIDYRVDATATLLEGFLRVVYAWQDKLSMTCSADVVRNMVRIPVPVLQGWSVDDYLRSLDLMMAVWKRWEPWLAPPALIGLGSVCRRELMDRKHGLYAILAGLEGHLPPGARLHLFGVKGPCLSEIKMYNWIASADSMGFDFSARVKARQRGISNTIGHRSEEMSRWMTTATHRASPAAGDQFRLTLAA